jgi:carbonic anhydrase/acetyltransferase-like protein (isoleucine patch superfamily)
MGAIILDDTTIGYNSIIAAGSLVLKGKNFPPGHLIGGSPARVIRALSDEEVEKNRTYARNYVTYKNSYLNKNIFKRIKEYDRE